MRTMMLETSLSVIDRSIKALRDAGYPAQAEELTAARVPISEQFANLAQPAQAVDVPHVHELIAQYWYLAYAEGKEGRTTDTAAGDAQRVLGEITRALTGEKAMRVDGWLPIETAPKEIEFRCLLGHPHSVVTGYWDGDGWVNERSKLPHGRNYFPASVWQPLPASPAPDKEG